MKGDVKMEATKSRQCDQLAQQEHQATDRCSPPCPDSVAPPADKVHRCFVNLPTFYPERLNTVKAFVDKAVKAHKVFSVQGPYPVIRTALRSRGWVEQRMHRPNHQTLQRHNNEGRASSNDAGDSDDNDDTIDKELDPEGLYDHMSRLVRNEMVYFYWTNRSDAINPSNLQKEQILNHFAKTGSFTTKAGLCVNLRHLHWFASADPDTFYPRCYRLGACDEKQTFIEDYRRTACTSLLKYIVERELGFQGEKMSLRIQDQRKQRKRQSRPVVLSQMIGSALKVCQEFLESLEHQDIDVSSETSQALTKEEWAEFLDNYYLVVHGGAEIENSDHFVSSCKAMLQRLEKVSPQLNIDGKHNIWIIKPGAKSRGRGIKCVKRLDQILRLVNGDPTLIRESKWVVQKYLERPLLVHDTKFDVRQWFLVTDWSPLTVWFYNKCYLRFSTQPFSLDILDSSVHLCNNSIQKHLRPSQQRHHGIPADNMWSDDQFKTFLSSQGQEAQWQSVVVPGMKKAVIYALQTAQDLMESRKNSFELYGADFMLGRDLRPWLIEINASPTMAPSTPVTARLCPAVQRDTLRVVLDRRADRNASTGDFQLIYRQAAVEVPQYIGVHLLVEGFKIKCPCQLPPLRSSNRSAPKNRGPTKEKEPATDKVNPLPKVSLRSAETLFKNDSCGVLPPPPPELVPLPISTFHLPITAPVPFSTQSHPMILCKKRPGGSKVSSEKVQPCTTEKYQSLSMPLKIFVPEQSRPAATSTMSA